MKIERLKLKRLNNTRDLGGLPASDGRTIVTGKLFRSGRLTKLQKATCGELRKMGVRTIIDLRTPTECSDHPDTMIEGIEYIPLPILHIPKGGITAEKTMAKWLYKESSRISTEFGSANNYMICSYREMVFEEEQQKSLSKVLRIIIEAEGGVLFHCTSGKDRAGICAMLIEALLGVDEEWILKDYMASAAFCRRKFFWNKFGIIVGPLPIAFKKILLGLMYLKPEFLDTIVQDMIERYGSVVDYCKQALGVTEADVQLLRSKYLV